MRTPKLMLLEQIAQPLAVDEVDWRRTVARRLLLGLDCGGARGDEEALSPRPAIVPRKSRTLSGVTLPLYLLHWKNTGKLTSEAVDADAVDPTVARAAGAGNHHPGVIIAVPRVAPNTAHFSANRPQSSCVGDAEPGARRGPALRRSVQRRGHLRRDRTAQRRRVADHAAGAA